MNNQIKDSIDNCVGEDDLVHINTDEDVYDDDDNTFHPVCVHEDHHDDMQVLINWLPELMSDVRHLSEGISELGKIVTYQQRLIYNAYKRIDELAYYKIIDKMQEGFKDTLFKYVEKGSDITDATISLNVQSKYAAKDRRNRKTVSQNRTVRSITKEISTSACVLSSILAELRINSLEDTEDLDEAFSTVDELFDSISQNEYIGDFTLSYGSITGVPRAKADAETFERSNSEKDVKQKR